MRQWYARYQRHSMGPTQASNAYRNQFSFDVRAVLPTIRVPTLVLHRRATSTFAPTTGATWPSASQARSSWRYPATNICSTSAKPDVILACGRGISDRPSRDWRRRIACWQPCSSPTSSARPNARPQLGDRAWRDLLEGYYGVARREVAALPRTRGRHCRRRLLRRLRRTGAAIRSACAIRDAAAGIGLTVRAGLHTGECEGRRESRWPGRPHRGARRRSRAAGRGAGVGDRAGPRRGFRHPVRGARNARAQGCPGRMGPVLGRDVKAIRGPDHASKADGAASAVSELPSAPWASAAAPSPS